MATAIAAIAAVALISRGPDPRLQIHADRLAIPAGGASAQLTIGAAIPLVKSGMQAVVSENGHSARIAGAWFAGESWHVTVQSKALPGRARITVSLPDFAAESLWVTISANDRDSVGDGTPDVLRLDDPADSQAFRSWFTFLAEAQFYRDTAALPVDIADCAGLIRVCLPRGAAEAR